ncbi:hypothetical protein [Streptomyces cinereoruber]|uniref:hypothetical protein n=1 Tax=Streptomyces cinereoruber TaxID=67260 RepID=UPI0036384A28
MATREDGRAVWTFPAPLAAPPAVAALPVTPAPGGDVTYTVVLEEATVERVTVRVWRTRALLGLGLLPSVPAGPGIGVHLLATELPSAPQLA